MSAAEELQKLLEEKNNDLKHLRRHLRQMEDSLTYAETGHGLNRYRVCFSRGPLCRNSMFHAHSEPHTAPARRARTACNSHPLNVPYSQKNVANSAGNRRPGKRECAAARRSGSSFRAARCAPSPCSLASCSSATGGALCCMHPCT